MNKTFILIGPGNVGLSVASLLKARGYHCLEVVSRTSDGWDEVKSWIGDDINIHLWEEWTPIGSDLVLVATPDDTLTEIGAQLVQKYHDTQSRAATFIHFSGIQSSEEFASLQHLGFQAASLHPLQSVPSVESGLTGLLGCSWAFEGDSHVQCANIVQTLDGEMIQLTAENKIPYHLAAVFASNLLTALEAMAIDIAEAAEIPEDKFLDLFAPLIRRSLENALKQSPAKAITGPLKRADTTTIKKHLAWLEQADHKYTTVYSELSHYLIEVLFAEDTLSLQEVDELTQLLDESA